VATRFERDQAGKLAAGVNGVQRVDNRIRVQAPAADPRTDHKT
jgi:osmotically-inducible protein OsmY